VVPLGQEVQHELVLKRNGIIALHQNVCTTKEAEVFNHNRYIHLKVQHPCLKKTSKSV
jgi:hypothetical protein